MLSVIICIECRFGRENQGILARLRFETQMGQRRDILGVKSSSFIPLPSEYSSINHTIFECKQPSHEHEKATDQVTNKELIQLEFGS